MHRKVLFRMMSVLTIAAILLFSVPLTGYSVTVNETEYNGSTEKANEIALNGSVEGVISSLSDEDHFKLTAKSSGYIVISLDHAILEEADAAWRVAVLSYSEKSHTNTEIYSTDCAAKTKSVLPKIGLAPGVYYVRIKDARYPEKVTDVAYTMTFAFTETEDWESEPNGNDDKADEIVFGNTYGGFCGSVSDEDYYKISAKSSGYLVLSFDHEILEEADAAWRVIVYSYSEKSHTNTEIYSTVCKAKTKSVLPKIGLAPGVYYVCIKDARYPDKVVNVEYQMTFDFTETEYWESEPNGSSNNADEIVFGNTYGGFCGSVSDEDYFKISAKSSGYLVLSFGHEILEEADAAWRVNVYSYSEQSHSNIEIYSCVCKAKTDRVLPKIGLAPGVYYVCVKDARYPDKVVNVEYQMTFDFTETEYWESEPNGTSQKADDVVLGKTYGGFIGSLADEDYFKITAKSSGSLVLSFDHEILEEADASWIINIYKYSDRTHGNISVDSVKCSAKTVGELPAVGIEPGIYYVCVRDARFPDKITNIEYALTFGFPSGEEESTTEAPTTEELTTEAPTTEAPTTEAPTTEAPTTEAPATEAPTTEELTTEAPTTEEPTTEEPTTEEMTTEAPTTEDPEKNFTLGDVNMDGKVNSADARLALRAAARLETLSDLQARLADANGDGSLKAADARLILRFAAKLDRDGRIGNEIV